MKLESVSVPATSRFASLYQEQKQPVVDYFHYQLKDETVYENRLAELKNKSFQRENLVQSIKNYMKPFPTSDKITQSLEKLRGDGVVVIGGQQAGVFTGPLYTIHKVISIIKLAEEQEKRLGHPVVPVFWIAGEDHDYEEINHIFVKKQGELKKMGYPERLIEKKMATHITIDKEKLSRFTHELFTELGEREGTKSLHNMIHQAIECSNTFVDFFSCLIMTLFKDSGLLLIDAADSEFRKLEIPHFQQLFNHSSSITEAVLETQQKLRQDGFSPIIDVEEDSMNLFYYHDHDRKLLKKNDDKIMTKDGQMEWDYQDLYQQIEVHPEIFSNNVVTRPIMQEKMFPTLAFIAGPGEMAYWAELKDAFECVQEKMPPIVPRLSLTLVEPHVHKFLLQIGLTPDKVLMDGIKDSREKLFQTHRDVELEQQLESVKNYLQEQYETIALRGKELDLGLTPIIEKNIHFHTRQLDFLLEKVQKSAKWKDKISMNHLEEIEVALKPNGAPQERVWNVLYFLNKYGEDFIPILIQQDLTFDGKHKVVYL
ncbi:hypothetical protein Q75_05620 [Bacillus coahuilensis p1.1.43]|uniref:Putative cysteine ligase BshC n=1 Tax=Bacillus coahuilensis p1.1.43 TaxID=1150625 RepID=A0A147K9X5_9BACI|nr:hypothetical protein Q75_05620 [Bacillus coahuilensis p1.1.43]